MAKSIESMQRAAAAMRGERNRRHYGRKGASGVRESENQNIINVSSRNKINNSNIVKRNSRR